ncbi:MAG: hypothetical protein AABW92_05735 [Nanoarchaeota archaeon]
MVKANVDRILEILREKKVISMKSLAAELGIKKEDAEKSAEYLERDGLVKIQHKFPNTMVSLAKDNSFGNTDDSIVPPPEMHKVHKKELAPKQPLFNKKEEKPMQKQPIEPLPLPINIPAQDNFTRPDTRSYPQPKIVQPAPVVEKPKAIQSVQPVKPVWPEKPPTKKVEWPEDTRPKNQVEFNPFSQPKQYSPVRKEIDENPLEPDKPDFDLSAPTPDGKHHVHFRSYDFPLDIKTDIDRINFLLDKINENISKNKYDSLNEIYRLVYDTYSNSTSMSQEERYSVGDKIESAFERIKEIYIRAV